MCLFPMRKLKSSLDYQKNQKHIKEIMVAPMHHKGDRTGWEKDMNDRKSQKGHICCFFL